jgi:hypothetical protein
VTDTQIRTHLDHVVAELVLLYDQRRFSLRFGADVSQSVS